MNQRDFPTLLCNGAWGIILKKMFCLNETVPRPSLFGMKFKILFFKKDLGGRRLLICLNKRKLEMLTHRESSHISLISI